MQITDDAVYTAALREFEELAFSKNSTDTPRLLELRDAINDYEVNQGQTPPLPSSIAGRLEVEMYKLRLNQKSFAALIGIPESRLSEIINGKRKPNLELVKRLHVTLKIPADELLELA